MTEGRERLGGLWRRHSAEVWWWLFVVVNTVAILLFREWATVPFHFIWISLALVYGWRVWSVRATAVVLGLIVVLTSVTMTLDVASGDQSLDELTEIPLMATVFLVMVWFVRRALATQQEVERVSERNLELLRREQGFIQDASHMLRTPLTIALGNAEVLQRSTTDPEALVDLQLVVDELHRLGRITNRLLLLARSDRMGFVRPGVSSVLELLEQAHQRWQAVCPTLRLGAAEEAWIRFDADRVMDALDELIGNAVSHTPDGTAIELCSWADGPYQVLAVSDEGPGVAETDDAKIFERWTRGNGDQTAHRHGVGLGLSIVKSVAEAHGGSVRVSHRPGRPGASFEIRLPRVDVRQPAVGLGTRTGRSTS